MSELPSLGPHGYRLLKQFERGPIKRLINGVWVAWPRSPGGAALKAYPCSARKWTIGWGCTTWFDGKPVREGYTLENEAQAEELLLINLRPFELLVHRLVTAPEATPFQRDALICLAFNIGQGAFKNTTALRETNKGNPELASEGFCLWTGITTYSPTSKQASNPEYAAAIGQKDGKWIWMGPTGEPCGYMTRSSGLLRRRLSEALLSEGLPWEEACPEDGSIKIKLRPPSHRLWSAGNNRWEDRIKSQTTLADVRDIAELHPLDADDLLLFEPSPIMIEPDDLDIGEVELIEPVEASTSPTEHVEAALPEPAVGAQPPAARGPASPPSSSPAIVVPSAGEGKEAAAKPSPVASSPPTPAVVAGQGGTKPIHPWSKQVNEVDYKLDTSAPLKPLETSERAIGYFWQRLAKGFIYVGASGAFGTGVTGVSTTLVQTAPLMQIALELTTPAVTFGAIAATGFVTKAYGDWKRSRGQERASQGLY